MKRSAFTIFLIFIFLTIYSQKEELVFKHFLTEDGLPSREVYTVAEDRLGYMWFGTDNGVSRYDGYEFKNYSLPNDFEANVINSIKVQKDIVWFGSLYCGAYYYYNEKILPYKYNYLLEKFKGKYISSTLDHISKEGDFYFSLYDFGIVKISADGKLTAFQNIDNNGFIAYEIEGRIFGTRSIIKKYKKTFFNDMHLEFVNKKRKPIELSLSTTGSEKIFGQVLDSDNSFFYEGKDLYLVTGNQRKKANIAIKVNEIVFSKNKDAYISYGDFYGLGYAASKKDLMEGKITLYLKNNNISSTYIDNNNGLWVTSTNNGVFYCKNPKQKLYSNYASEKDATISAIEPISLSECYFGTTNTELLLVQNDRVNKMKAYPFPSLICEEIFYDEKESNIYTLGGFLHKNKWTLKKIKPTMLNSSFKNFSPDFGHNKIWISNYRGYGYFEKNTNVTYFDGIKKGEFIRIFDILFAKDTLWFATQYGLYASHLGLSDPLKINHPSLNVRINSVAINNYGDLILGTKEEGVIIKKQNGKLEKFNETSHLASNNVKHVSVDDNNNIWVSTNKGLSKIDFISNKIRNFNSSHGLPTDEIFLTESYKNQLWIASGKGLVKFNEKEINFMSPRPIITTLNASNDAYSIPQQISLPYNKNNIILKYKTINPALEGKIKYRYKFSNSNTWTETFSTSLELLEMSAGHYILSIESANEDGIFSSPTTLEFIIKPPWWRTYWFYFSVLSLVGFLAYTYFQSKSKALIKESKLISELNRLEKVALQNQMNPHFLSNAFTSLQYLIHDNKLQQADDYLSDLSRLIRKILDSSRSNEVTLRQEIELIKLYLQLEKIRFENKFEYEIDIDEKINQDLQKIPPMLIQPIIENSINHAFTSLDQEKNIISIHFTSDEKNLICSISDNGIGINSSKLNAKSSTKKSYALSIIKERIANYNQSNENDISVSFIDKSESALDKGTEVIFRFPLNLL